MKNPILYFSAIFFAANLYAQEDCNCGKALKQLILKVEAEYPGFGDKTKDKPVYNNYKEDLLLNVKDIREPFCIEILRNYVTFFRDGHLSIIPSGNGQVAQGNNGLASKVAISKAEFEKRLLTTTDPLEGVWRSGTYKVGIVKLENEYQGFIMEADTAFWRADEIKFRLFEGGKADFYLKDHSLSEETYELVDGWILYFNYSKYFKELPKPEMSDSEMESRKNEVEGCYFKMLSEKTAMLCLSDFRHNYVDRIWKLLEDNKTEIENSEFLIIDVRNNLGGTYDAYECLFPYVLTGNIRGSGMEFLATQTLIDGIRDWYDDEEDKKRADEWIKMFKVHMGEFVNSDTTEVCITYVKLAEQSPGQVVILVNQRTASSAEAFVLDAKQSKKVKILGTPTYGALDYGSVSIFDFGCDNYKLAMPTWRSMRLPDFPIDNIGIQPDIYLDKTVTDWVRFALDYLEK